MNLAFHFLILRTSHLNKRDFSNCAVYISNICGLYVSLGKTLVNDLCSLRNIQLVSAWKYVLGSKVLFFCRSSKLKGNK